MHKLPRTCLALLLATLLFTSCQATKEEQEEADYAKSTYSFWPLTTAAVETADFFAAGKAGQGSQGYARFQQYLQQLENAKPHFPELPPRHALPQRTATWLAITPDLGKMPPPADEYQKTFSLLIAALAAPDTPSNWRDKLEAFSVLHKQQTILAEILDQACLLNSGAGQPELLLKHCRSLLAVNRTAYQLLHQNLSPEVREPGEKAAADAENLLHAVGRLHPFLPFAPLWDCTPDSPQETKPTTRRLLAVTEAETTSPWNGQPCRLSQNFLYPPLAATREIFLLLPPTGDAQVELNGQPLPGGNRYRAVNITAMLHPGQTHTLTFRLSAPLDQTLILPWLASGNPRPKQNR